jgi:hypothetical protein
MSCSEGQMTFSRIDWVVMWKLYHVQFLWIYLALGIPLRVVAARSFGASTSKTTSSVIVASFVSSVSCTWLPIAPVICCAAFVLARARAVGESRLISVPVVAVTMGIETAFLDALLFPMLLKQPVKRRFVSLLIANTLNASIALALILVWEFHHPTIFLRCG